MIVNLTEEELSALAQALPYCWLAQPFSMPSSIAEALRSVQDKIDVVLDDADEQRERP